LAETEIANRRIAHISHHRRSRPSPGLMAPKPLKTRRKYFAPGLQNISPIGAEWA